MSLTLYNAGTVATDGGNDTIWQGGRGFFVAESSAWSGGSATLQWKSPLGTWITIGSAAVLVGNGCVMVELPRGIVRVLKTGSPTALYAYLLETEFE